jgi:hypothetical protein
MSGPVWYFAYGSNMQPATFAGRRGIVPLRAVAARLAGWRVVFDKPPILPIGEAMANLVEEAEAEVLGVAYEVTARDLEHIDLTEGVTIGNYQRIEVPVAPIGPVDAIELAFTLVSDRRDADLKPSRRYMSCLIAGAEHHALPAEYVEFLRSVPACEDSEEARHFRAMLDRAMQREK